MNNFDFVIIGSGISGMSFARLKAKEGKSVLVLERKGYAGGCVHSLTHEDFWLELGGHTIYNSYQSFITALRDLNLEDKFLPREKASFKMYDNGEIKKITSKLNKLELAMNGMKLFLLKKEGKSVRDYYSSVLGKNNYENMFYGMLQAVISQDASDFPADMLLKKRDRDKTAPRNFTLKGGMKTFIEAVSEMENVTVMTDCEAVDISFADGLYTVETAKGVGYKAQNLTMACPPPTAGKLLAEVAPDVSELLCEMKGVKVESMGIIVKKEDIAIEPFSFVVAKDEPFTSAVSRDIIPHDKYRGMTFHFREDALDKEGKISKIEDVLGIDRGVIIASAETVHFSPTLDMSHKSRIKKLSEAVSKHDSLNIVGNYFGGIAIEDCVLSSKSL